MVLSTSRPSLPSAGAARLLAGIFVGGQGRRMGGSVKGLLQAPDTGQPLVVRMAALLEQALPGIECVLVGAADAYAALGLPALADEPAGVGPIGGLGALLAAARARDAQALALACDLPYVTATLIARLGQGHCAGAALVPRIGGVWQPLFARYEPERVLPALRATVAAGELALQRVLVRLGPAVVELPLEPSEGADLDDWDEPADLQRRPPGSGR